jgi:hypothetical protein
VSLTIKKTKYSNGCHQCVMGQFKRNERRGASNIFARKIVYVNIFQALNSITFHLAAEDPK